MHAAWMLPILLTADPQLTIVVAEPWEDCWASEFVEDSFTATADDLREMVDPLPDGYFERLTELRCECEPFRVIDWREYGLSSDCDGLPLWTIDDDRGYVQLTPIRRDVLLGCHVDCVQHLAYMRSIVERAYDPCPQSQKRIGDFDSQTYLSGREKWFRRVYDNCKQEDGRDVTFYHWVPVIEPWPPVDIKLPWRRTLHDRVTYDCETNTEQKASQHVVYEPDWSAIREAYDMGANVMRWD